MTTVADIVVGNPAAARVFEQHDIDFCCHGRRPLDEACAEAGVDPAVVRAERDALGTPPLTISAVGAERGIGSLIDHIVSTHHRYLREELPRLGAAMDKVIRAHAERHPELHDVARDLGRITEALLPHLVEEERVLFPKAIELLGAIGPVAGSGQRATDLIASMHDEHDAVGELLAALRRGTNGYTVPDDACPTWRALAAGLAELEHDVHTHVHLENNVLFPRIVELEGSLG